jgi:hypothetical protein
VTPLFQLGQQQLQEGEFARRLDQRFLGGFALELLIFELWSRHERALARLPQLQVSNDLATCIFCEPLDHNQ